ncbi:MAG: ATP-dependent zinc metalloprotease FtsH [Clostridia bacterium]|nr:ATP-dependent zinc metalloprotease FtsH [Clostridia bacterium]
MKTKKNGLVTVLIYFVVAIVVLVGIYMLVGDEQEEKLSYSELVSVFLNDEVKEYALNLSNGELVYVLKAEPEKKVSYSVPSVNIFLQDVHDHITEYNKTVEKDLQVKEEWEPGRSGSMILSFLPTILVIIITIVLFFVMTRKINSSDDKAMKFGKAKTKQITDEKRKTTFSDVEGADEEKEELREIVEFLKNPSKFNDLGARIPKGVLLVGPPGTGKTLLARAVAGEAKVPFFSISGSDFVEMFVGVGASRVRDLFQQAKKASPSIIFIDEIDAVGRHRGAGMGGGHDEREQTLNQLLVEMDGFGINEGVIIIAATNRPDILDPALLRPGRFDRQVIVGRPDIKGRESILRLHAKNKPLAPDVDLKKIAGATAGFTGADLENLLNEAALLAARKDLKAITMDEIEEATIKVVAGTEKKSAKITDKEKKLVSYHEAGHAVATYYSPTQDPVHQISIIPRGMAGGYTMSIPSEDRNYVSKKHMLENIVVLLGGRVAEALILGDISTGASNDIERASKIARNMITRYGMSDKLGPIAFGSSNDEVFLGRDYSHMRDYSESVAAEIDAEVSKVITGCYKRTTDILSEHMDKLHKVAEYLFKHEKIDGDDFRKIMEGEEIVSDEE